MTDDQSEPGSWAKAIRETPGLRAEEYTGGNMTRSSKPHIMLDLETWGTEPGCDIRSIGACVFDPVTGITEWTGPGTFYVACENPRREKQFAGRPERRYDLHRDPRTVQWWSEQSDEAQAAFADPVDLRVALGRFTHWLMSVAPGDGPIFDNRDIRLWSHGPAFDPPILAAAYRAVECVVPWHYRAPRDTRTCFDMAGIDDHSAWLGQYPGPLGVPHHALDDAICQARAVCAAYERVRSLISDPRVSVSEKPA